jgi:hypothetical protein
MIFLNEWGLGIFFLKLKISLGLIEKINLKNLIILM